MTFESFTHLLSRDHDKNAQEVVFTPPSMDPDRIRSAKNRFAKLTAEKKAA